MENDKRKFESKPLIEDEKFLENMQSFKGKPPTALQYDKKF